MRFSYRALAASFTLGLAACVTAAPTPPPPSAAPLEAAPAAPAANDKPPIPALGVTAATAKTADPPPEIVGGYTAQDVGSPAIQASAAEAITLLQASKRDTSIALVAVRRAETQVVAGKNTRMTLDIKAAAGPRTVTVVLYKDLSGHGELTSIEGF